MARSDVTTARREPQLSRPDVDLDLNGLRLRNRVLTSASLAGYGLPGANRILPYGLSPVAQFLPLERMGAVTTRTLTVEPRAGHFTTRTDWRPREWPAMLRMYSGALRRIDAGWMCAFGWCTTGVEAYLRDYFLFPRTVDQNRIVSLGGFSADEFTCLIEIANEGFEAGSIAAVELNVSCHNVNVAFGTVHELRAEGRTILLVEQAAARTVVFADRSYVLNTGRGVLAGSREEIAKADFAKAYLGGVSP